MIRDVLTSRDNIEGIAVIERDREIPYSALIEKARAVQSLLTYEQRECAAIFLPNGSAYIAALWGALLSGVRVLPLNALLTRGEMEPLLRQAAADCFVTLSAHRGLFEGFATDAGVPIRIIHIDELTGRGDDEAAYGRGESTVLLGTSGTVGAAKIVQLSQGNIEAAVAGYLDRVCFARTRPDAIRYILAVPFSSVYGIMILSACLMRSLPVVVPDEPFALSGLYRSAEMHSVTHYEGGTTAIELMAQTAGRPIPYRIDTLRYFGCGGSKVSGRTIERVLQAYPGIEIHQGYGMTEAAPLIAKHPPGRVVKTESVGIAIRGVEIAVAAEGGITHEPFVRGEILVRGANVMMGYYGNEAATERALSGGYLHTGDIGYLDGDGYLYICGRKKNVIIVRGYNVYPEEVEACIQHSGLTKDCRVYGKLDERGQELVCADAVPVGPQVRKEDIAEYCAAHLAIYKRPREIALCSAIAKTASGKTDRRGGSNPP